MVDSRLARSQLETSLQSNAIFQLVASLESALRAYETDFSMLYYNCKLWIYKSSFLFKTN